MNNQKHFFNLFLGVGLHVVLGVITTPVITRIVAPEAYGNLSLFLLFSNVFLIVAVLGQDQAYARFFYSRDEEEYKQYVLKSASRIPLIIAVIGSAVILCGYLIIPGHKTVWLIFAVQIIFITLGQFSNMVCRLKMRTTLYSLIINVQKLIYVGLAVLMVLVFNWDHLIALTMATMIAQVGVCIIGVSAERRQWSVMTLTDAQKTDFHSVVTQKELLAYGIPFVFANLCNWVFTGADKIMIKAMASGTELGIYASAVSVVGIFSIITTTFCTIWGPMAIEKYEKDNSDTSFFIKAMDYISVILFMAGAGVVLFKDLIVYLLGSDYRTAVFLLPFLTLHPIMYSISETTVYGINFAKKTKLHIIIAATCAAFNIVLNFILIPEIGALGAAIATGVTYILFFIMRTKMSLKCFPVAYNLKKLALTTALYMVFVVYNSWNTIDVVSVIMFIVFAVVLFVGYKQSIIELSKMGLDYLKGILNKFKR